MSLYEMLNEYASSGVLPMHMPGHKRNAEMFPFLDGLGCRIDITEIEGFDDLNDPHGCFAELETRAARIWGADESVCLVNGSTGGILAAIWASMETSDGARGLLISRASHRSVYNAAEIVGADVRYIVPTVDRATGIAHAVTADDVRQALDAHPDIRAAVITSPTYEGVICDVRAIADVCHERGVVLIVDEAHGAHLSSSAFGRQNAARLGADLSVCSLHKTLPALTQTAMLHINGGRVDVRLVRRAAAMFQSSSPSYILSASADGCVRFLETDGGAAAQSWRCALDAIRERCRALSHLRLLSECGPFPALDPSKLTVLTCGTDISGPAFAKLLRVRFNIEPEMTSARYTVAMTGMGDTAQSLSQFADALLKLDSERTSVPPECAEGEFFTPHLPVSAISVREALTAKGRPVPLADAIGKTSGEYVWAYPPGIPLLVPGEVVDDEAVRAISEGVNIRSTYGGAPETIFCVG